MITFELTTAKCTCFKGLISFIILNYLIIVLYARCVNNENSAEIILITPTLLRPERLADMTRMAQTLMHIKNIFWVVIEDADNTSKVLEQLLKRSQIPHVHLHRKTTNATECQGCLQRNKGLEYIREKYKNKDQSAVVYFADDDNTYDIRVFDKYVRRVKTIGVWANGLSGGSLVHAPRLKNGKVIGWDVHYNPERKFRLDHLGFAVNLKLILRSNATQQCKSEPEPCFLEQFDIEESELEAFGWNENPKEILVWHTKTVDSGVKKENHGYLTEF